MSVLVVAEHDNKNLKSSTLNTISAAEKLSEDIHPVSYTHLTLPTT